VFSRTREFIILPEFQKCWQQSGLDEEDLRELEIYLCLNPSDGDVVPSPGGLRKLRWTLEGKGKRGGSRILYVDLAYYEKIYLITVFPKNVRTDLNENEKKQIIILIKSLENALRG
jgi:hypothetical protein